MGAKVSFNEITKIITVTLAPVDGEVFIDVKADLYSDGKEDWVANENLRKFIFPITSVAGNPLPGSKELGPTFFIASDWKIRPYEASHKLTVNGNLYAVDGSDPFLDTLGTYTVRIMQQVSSLVDSTIAQLHEIEYASFNGGVTIDVISGVSGTAYPAGTIEMPVGNLVDAIAIAELRGFNVLFIKGNITLSNTVNLENYTIRGESIVKSKITIQSSALVFGTEFMDATITGTLDGDNTIHHCAIQTLNYVRGHVHSCLLEEYTITLAGMEETVFLNCWSAGASQAELPIIDMGGSGRGLIVRGHSGGIKLINKSGSESVALDFESGRVIIADTVEAGNIIIRGIGQVTDNSIGTTTVDITGVVSQITIADAVWSSTEGEALLANIEKILSVTYIKETTINDPIATTTKFITSFAEAGTFWVRASILFLDGQNAGLIRGVKTYNGITKEIQVQTPLAFAPADGDKFVIIAARKFLTPDVGELADAVWVHASAEFMLKVIKNKKSLVKSGSVWELIIYDDDDITPILNKEMKDKDGNNITDLAAGVLARELKNTV